MLTESKASGHRAAAAAAGRCMGSDGHGAAWLLLRAPEAVENGPELRVPTSHVQVWVMDAKAPVIAWREAQVFHSFLEPNPASHLQSPGSQSRWPLWLLLLERRCRQWGLAQGQRQPRTVDPSSPEPSPLTEPYLPEEHLSPQVQGPAVPPGQGTRGAGDL